MPCDCGDTSVASGLCATCAERVRGLARKVIDKARRNPGLQHIVDVAATLAVYGHGFAVAALRALRE